MSESNFTTRVKQPWTTYDNTLIQGETIFKSANQKLCYMYLYSYANASKIFPSIDTIAQAVCCKRRTAINVIQELEELGLIEVIRTPGKSNQYILNDYFEIVEITSAKSAPVQNLHQTSAKSAPLPVQNLHPITKTKKLKTKNKISSRESIDISLKEKYSNAPFDEVRDNLLNDKTLIVNTDKQYKSMLEYRLKNWKPAKPKNKKTSIRKEVVPEWLHKENKAEKVEVHEIPLEDIEMKKAEIKEQLKKLRKQS